MQKHDTLGLTPRTTEVDTSRFDKSLSKDIQDYHVSDTTWSHCRNAINNSISGDLGSIGNEPSNLFCASAPYTVVGMIYLFDDKWIVFSTNREYDAQSGVFVSEIGLFDKLTCCYISVFRDVNNSCLNLSQAHLIKGVSTVSNDCSYHIFWDDGFNPTRTLNLGIPATWPNCKSNPTWDCTINVWPTNDINNYSLPYTTHTNTPSGCSNDCDFQTPDLPLTLNCDELRLARLVTPPCIKVTKSKFSGTLENGQYAIAIAYSNDGIKCSDYYLSNIVSIYDHRNVSGSIDITISNIDNDNYNEFELAVLYMTNFQTRAKTIGHYSTKHTHITLDAIDNALPNVPIHWIPLNNPVYEKTDYMTTVNDYLLRIAPTTKLDFNYQPFANRIVTKWQSVEYPSTYYVNGGVNNGYMRDEVYTFFIRWVYNTGDRSMSYIIPGRPPQAGELVQNTTEVINADGPLQAEWFVKNTAFTTSTLSVPQSDGGTIIAEGYMGYYESSEYFDATHSERWNTTASCNSWLKDIITKNSNKNCLDLTNSPYNLPGVLPTDYNLCGKPIRLHRIPDETTGSGPLDAIKPYNSTNNTIRIIGVKFENILPPIDNHGNVLTNVVGYEILRGTRDGNRTIIAKGIINNLGVYDKYVNGANVGHFAYPNYPYNDVSRNPFLTTDNFARLHPCYQLPSALSGFISAPFAGQDTVQTNSPAYGNLHDTFSKQFFTFHSPETTFQKPYLSAKELKLYSIASGNSLRQINQVELHPKYKLISDFATIFARLISIAHVAHKIEGDITMQSGKNIIGNLGANDLITGPIAGADTALYGIASLAEFTAFLMPIFAPGFTLAVTALTGITATDVALGTEAISLAANTSILVGGGGYYETPTYHILPSEFGRLPLVMRHNVFIPFFTYYMTEAVDEYIRLFRNMVSYRNYAAKFVSHGYYDKYDNVFVKHRYDLEDSVYCGNGMINFKNIHVNNKYRTDKVLIKTTSNIPNISSIVDKSRWNLTDMQSSILPSALNNIEKAILGEPNIKYRCGTDYTNVWGKSLSRPISSYYAAMKQEMRNLYGQLENIKQVLIGCIQPVNNLQLCQPVVSDILFGGDIYINRYAEKDVFFYFYNWPATMPDGTEWDYRYSIMGLYPRYWINSQQNISFDDLSMSLQLDTGSGSWWSQTSTVLGFLWQSSLLGSLVSSIFPSSGSSSAFSNFLNNNDASTYLVNHNLDGCPCNTIVQLSVKNGLFYLYEGSIRDFWVESEINLAQRDYGDRDSEQCYIPYRQENMDILFQDSIIKYGDYFKYDFSLSISKFTTNNASWGHVQPELYSPFFADKCYTYLKNTIIYSLPRTEAGHIYNWYSFLPNNFKSFERQILSIKELNKTGSLILFKNAPPKMFTGTDVLKTNSDVKITLGDGGLFNQSPQNLVNVEAAYEYGSCQNINSVINTPYGVYWVSADQDKVFVINNGIQELSNLGMRWWFSTFTYFRILQDFPDYDVLDNQVLGVGIISTYDNTNGLIYFCKKDKKLIDNIPNQYTYNYLGGGTFSFVDKQTNVVTITTVNDTNFFEDCSWTISYDPKANAFISFHDWKPNWAIGSQDTFCTIDDKSFWTHNVRCDSYCNFYNKQYPFEIEFIINSKINVATIRNVEYYMEVYKYDKDNCYDRFHKLDFNFDKMIISNTEQNSGLLNLNLHNKANPFMNLNYPQYLSTFVNVLYSKEENRYRVNQFCDLIKDRGEFSGVETQMWNTEENGYVKTINNSAINYSKPATQRKKFRHYKHYVWLSKDNCFDKKMIVNLAFTKRLSTNR